MNSLLQLCRWKVSLAVSFAALTGYILNIKNINPSGLLIILGVFLLASGASVINQIQEQKTDRLMSRTSLRPIPSGRIKKTEAIGYAILFILIGSLMLLYYSWLAFLIGLFTVFWYILVYTPLKRKTAFAVVPGSLTGALPAFIGWTASGGSLYNPQIIFLGFFIFLWQIPHFWLLLTKYSRDYERAGLPSLLKTFSFSQIKSIIFSWMIATCLLSTGFFFFGIISSLQLIIAGILINLFIITSFSYQLFYSKSSKLHTLFIQTNIYLSLFLIILIIDNISL